MKKRTIHDKRLNEDAPSVPHPDAPSQKERTRARPFAYRNFGTETRKNYTRSAVSGRGIGQALIDFREMTHSNE